MIPSQFTDRARDREVPEEVPELDPRLLGRETRRFQGQEDGMPGVKSQRILNLYRTLQSLCYC
jgi:hypothetical protein